MIAIYIVLILAHLATTLYFYATGVQDSLGNYLYNLTATLFTILPIVVSWSVIRRQRTSRPVLVPFVISFFAYTVAQIIWFYYRLTGVAIPFPGIADILFLAYYPLVIVALINAARLIKLKWDLGSNFYFFLVFLLLALVIFSFNSSSLGQQETLSWLANVYTFSDALLVAIALTLLRHQILLGNYNLVYFSLGYLIMALSDILFAYSTYLGKYWNGNIVDFLYVLAHASVALGTGNLVRLFRNKRT